MGTLSICTSWDDGAVEDVKLVELLAKYCIPAMLFVPAENRERPVMAPSQVRELAEAVEIGSHTYHHVRLHRLPIAQAVDEVVSGGRYLEDALGAQVPHFCFPGGKFTRRLLAALRGKVRTARTAAIMSSSPWRGGLRVDPTLHVALRPGWSLVKHTLWRAPAALRLPLLRAIRRGAGWTELAGIFIDHSGRSARADVVLHVWGHSWEIEELGRWRELEDLFRFLSAHRGSLVRYSTLYG